MRSFPTDAGLGASIARYHCDNALLRRLTGWEPRTALLDGLRRTAEWYREHGGCWALETINPDLPAGPVDRGPAAAVGRHR